MTSPQVWLARDRKEAVTYALKKEKLGHPEGFRITTVREMKILRDIRHPNVVSCMEMRPDRAGDNLYMVLEYADHDLQGYTQAVPGGPTLREAKCLVYQLVRGMEAMHSMGYLHRDLKPENVSGGALRCGLPVGAWSPGVVGRRMG